MTGVQTCALPISRPTGKGYVNIGSGGEIANANNYDIHSQWSMDKVENVKNVGSLRAELYFYAYPILGYYFVGWDNNDDGTIDDGKSVPLSKTLYPGLWWDTNETHKFYAIFQPITVSGYTVNNISISDINTAGQGTVVFDVTNSSDVDVNDFDYNIIGEGFSIVNKSYASGKLTVTVQYTSQTTDNVDRKSVV